MIRNYSASDEAILAHMAGLLPILQPMNPILFYLASGDVGQQLARARESRGESPATKEQIAHWENGKRVAVFVLERLALSAYVLSIDCGWDRALEVMTEHILQ